MKQNITKPSPNQPQKIQSTKALGELIRAHRKAQNLTLAQISGISGLGMRFISELERGKETAELGKTLILLNNLGIELIMQPRRYRSASFDKTKVNK